VPKEVEEFIAAECLYLRSRWFRFQIRRSLAANKRPLFFFTLTQIFGDYLLYNYNLYFSIFECYILDEMDSLVTKTRQEIVFFIKENLEFILTDI